jgi:hypothetical protein
MQRTSDLGKRGKLEAVLTLACWRAGQAWGRTATLEEEEVPHDEDEDLGDDPCALAPETWQEEKDSRHSSWREDEVGDGDLGVVNREAPGFAAG